MIDTDRRAPQSLQKLKLRGDQLMADAHQAVANAQRLALETAELLAETVRLHERPHGRQ